MFILHQLQSNGSTLHAGEQIRLRKAISARVYILTTDRGAQEALFRSLYSALNERYRVSSYHKIKSDKLQDALRFIERWSG